MTEVFGGKQIRISFDERTQYSFGNDFGAHRAMKKEIYVVLRPGRNLCVSDVGSDPCYRLAGICAKRDRQKKNCMAGASPANPSARQAERLPTNERSTNEYPPLHEMLQKNRLGHSMRTQIQGATDKIEDCAIYRQVLDADYSSYVRMIAQYFRIEADH